MAVTLIGFRTRFAEFKTSGDALIQSFLDDAAIDTSVSDFIADAGLDDEYTYFLAADKLAKSPYAVSARLVNKDGTTTYQATHERIWLRALTGL